MPYLTDSQLARVQSTMASAQNKVASIKARAQEKAGEIKDGLEIIGGATIMGLARGYAEKNNWGSGFNIPGTSVDIELAMGSLLVGLGMSDTLGKYDNDALMAGFGMLAHYSGQLSRNSVKDGKFTMVAGEHEVGAGQDFSSLLAGSI